MKRGSIIVPAIHMVISDSCNYPDLICFIAHLFLKIPFHRLLFDTLSHPDQAFGWFYVRLLFLILPLCWLLEELA